MCLFYEPLKSLLVVETIWKLEKFPFPLEFIIMNIPSIIILSNFLFIGSAETQAVVRPLGAETTEGRRRLGATGAEDPGGHRSMETRLCLHGHPPKVAATGRLPATD